MQDHEAAAVHDTGHQMMQTGRLFQGGVEYPHIGCVLSKLKGPNGDVPPHVLLPRPIGNTGGNMPHGQNAGFLGRTFDPFVLNADPSDPNFKVPDMLIWFRLMIVPGGWFVWLSVLSQVCIICWEGKHS